MQMRNFEYYTRMDGCTNTETYLSRHHFDVWVEAKTVRTVKTMKTNEKNVKEEVKKEKKKRSSSRRDKNKREEVIVSKRVHHLGLLGSKRLEPTWNNIKHIFFLTFDKNDQENRRSISSWRSACWYDSLCVW